MLFEIIFLSILLVLSALFSGLETAYVSISLVKARSFVERKLIGSKLMLKLKEDQKKLLITVLIGNNLVNVGASAYSAVVLTKIFGNAGIGIATAVMTLLILTFGEILPKTYFAKNAEKITLRFAPIILFLENLFLPLVWIFDKISTIVTPDKESIELITESEIKTIIEMGAEEEVIHKTQEELMQSVFKFDDTIAKEVMTPRVEIFAIEDTRKVGEVLKIIKEKGFSRIPLFNKSTDHLTGYVHIIDLLNAEKTTQLKKIANKIMFASSEKIIQELFLEMQKRRSHIVAIVDEFGGTAGIVTMEDILEELVGEIYDEQDGKNNNIKKIGKNTYIVKGDTEVTEINDKIKTSFKISENYSTIGGYLQKKFKNIPEEGEVYETTKFKLEVIKVSDKKIEKIKISKIKKI